MLFMKFIVDIKCVFYTDDTFTTGNLIFDKGKCFKEKKINHNPVIFIHLSFTSLSGMNVGSTSGMVHQEYAKVSRNIKQTTCICVIVPFASRKNV